ncbi:MAG: MotA/TolQ/ExbB proton channel family protein [Sinobacteraceae bacterium]|nr:MotA/TolQ/ExbB proton channel family protein [Nevskiaceae bacterium]
MHAEVFELLQAALAAPFQSVEDFFRLGGWVLKWILLAALFMWTLILERYWYIARVHPQRLAQRLEVWHRRSERRSWFARRIREQLISELKIGLSAPLPLIRVMVPLAPLLGLLGTVTGMLEVFDGMTAAGSSDVRAMAYGVSHAMIATLAGLVVSLIGLFFSVQLSARVRAESERLPDLLLPE